MYKALTDSNERNMEVLVRTVMSLYETVEPQVTPVKVIKYTVSEMEINF